MIIGCDFNYSAPIIAHDVLSFDYVLYSELQPTPIRMNLTVIKRLLRHPDLIKLLGEARETGQKTLITVHHDVNEIHRVLRRVEKDGEHHWREALSGCCLTATGTRNLMLHPIVILPIVVVVCLWLIIVLSIRMWKENGYTNCTTAKISPRICPSAPTPL